MFGGKKSVGRNKYVSVNIRFLFLNWTEVECPTFEIVAHRVKFVKFCSLVWRKWQRHQQLTDWPTPTNTPELTRSGLTSQAKGKERRDVWTPQTRVDMLLDTRAVARTKTKWKRHNIETLNAVNLLLCLPACVLLEAKLYKLQQLWLKVVKNEYFWK